tara:strand:- start:474 stop:1004 length:531 start_codon:yes stop_codon:yes gene_type:complete
MKKLLLKIFVFFLVLSEVAMACNFKISNFGDQKEDLNVESLNYEPLMMPDRFGGENIMIPLETICKNDKSFWDTKLILLYIDNQLVRIQLYRPLMDDRNLMDFAMKKYGQFNLPEGLPKKEWRGNYLWVKNTETIEYISANIHDGHAEYLEIVGKLYEDKMAIYNEEIGKWLDSRE